MAEPDKESVRRKMMGALLRRAREAAGRSKAEVASSLHVSEYRYSQYERGDRDLSLSELETVAALCGVPLGYFFDEEAALEGDGIRILHRDRPRLRNKIVGTLLRQARLQSEKTQKECADLLGVSPGQISQYEYGEQEIPLSELETLAPILGVEMSYFTV